MYIDRRGFEVTEEELDEKFRDFLDELCEPFRFGDQEYSAGRVLKEIDPISYEQEFTAWLASRQEDGDFEEIDDVSTVESEDEDDDDAGTDEWIETHLRGRSRDS